MKPGGILVLASVAAGLVGNRKCVSGQDLEDYFYAARAALPAAVVEGNDSGRFHLVISRPASSDWERELMERAESLYPPLRLISDSVSAHLLEPDTRGGIWGERFAEAAAAPGPRWWWLLEGAVGLPFALTGQAVAQYLEHFRSLRSGPNPYAEYNPGVEHRAELVYAARVHSQEDGYVVEMSLRWSFYCGPLCGLRLGHTRRVSFDQEGVVVRVEGDRRPAYGVS